MCHLMIMQAHEGMDALVFNLRQEHVVICDFVSTFHQVCLPIRTGPLDLLVDITLLALPQFSCPSSISCKAQSRLLHMPVFLCCLSETCCSTPNPFKPGLEAKILKASCILLGLLQVLSNASLGH